MNSDYINQKRPVLHGSSCPLNAIRTDTNVNTIFRNFFAKDMSPLVRVRIFEGYKDFSSITGLNNEYLTYIAKELLDPFVRYSYAEVQDFIEKGDPSRQLENARAIIREQLKNTFKNMKRINVLFDDGPIDSVHVGSKNSIKFLFDYPFSSLENGPLQDPLKCTWNSGVISFAGGGDITVTVFVPIQRLKEVVQEGFSKVASEQHSNVSDVAISSAFRKAREILTHDLGNAIISGIYMDRFRENLLAQIKAMYATIAKFVTGEFTIPNPDVDEVTRKEFNTMIQGYVQALIGKYLDKNSMEHPAIPSLNTILEKSYYADGSIQVHPWQIFNLFAHFSDVEVSAMLEKLHTGITGIENAKYDRDHTVPLSYLEHNFNNDHADVMSTCIQIYRTIPFTLMAVFVYGQGSKLGNYMRYIANVKEFIKSLETIGNSSLNMKNIIPYTKAINGYIEYADVVLSNPRLPEYMEKVISTISM